LNKREKIVQEQFLDNEEKVITRLKSVYTQALKDIESKSKALYNDIAALQSAINTEQDAEERARLVSMQQAKIYQKQYQDALKKQVGGILDEMHAEEFRTVSEYLQKCYEDGFCGAMYDLHGQGLPLIFPIDQEAVTRAVQLDSKISKGLYTRLGEDVALLKRKITAQVSRGIATGASFSMVAKQLADYTNIGYNNAVRIARTEGHRIQVQSGMDACYKAQEKGADVVKQWDAALDKRTRESHALIDGEIRELDETFSNGLRYPGDPNGRAEEVINCRCALLQRARKALDADELETLKERAAYFGLDKTANFEDFKEKYLKAVEEVRTQAATFTPAKTIEEAQEYAQRFVDEYKSKYSGIVDYSKIDVEVANDINEAITQIYNTYDAPRMRNIQLMNMREKRWRDMQAEAAYGWGAGDLFINGKWYKNAKTIAAHRREYTELLERVMPKIPDVIAQLEGDKGYTAATKRAYYKALLKSGRTNVFGVETKGTIIHEMGHMLDSEVFKLQRSQSAFDLKKSMEKYADGISAYATANSHEYVAESFAAYWKGETDIIDPELLKIFEGARKK
jgi:hypothetical protein